mmetsp:Transcript_52719/g.83666  ORF Transcript_52719/g.83666 Transcript_52719/m.83666 type:complete len:440 (-) Transcript_52719:94-1413(-)|eukprot:CAMPEP_0169118716 /NCGR_PEP_ID=MMETSP1015-20121227/31147_1 /TAXON_ID=342587 /ORGANISM="Karlodinium micrum, Strain CCMP2283" /LENGTH=439 /DNA_ID=CAMNT_0009181499 /DNA_START=107 /DNA_END=1426 /DNA_ORIENTATION=-
MTVRAKSSYLKPNEEEWRDVFTRLCERFPSVPPDRIAQTLRENNGHAGEVARVLRDQTGSHVKEADPDDIEHVSTLLSSPQMFKHACKEKFKKFDVNGDGVLEFDEVKNLTNSLYDEFGLQPPPEGALRAFFCATDENQDGVLSEREFRKFFEMFLRYAFFDHLKLRQMVEHGQALEAKRGSSNGKSLKRQTTDVWELCTDGKDSRASSASTAEKPPETLVSEPSPMSRSQSTPALQESGQGKRRDRHRDETNRDDRQRSRPDRNQERERGQSDAFGKTIRCLAPSGVAYRSSAAFQDKTDGVIGKGETVRVLEHWVRTSHGWLPMSDAQGTVLFERSAADQEEGARRPSSGQVYAVKKKVHISTTNNDTLEAVRNTPKHSNTVVNDVGGDLLPNEEEWRPVFERLCERFPNLGADKVAQALRDNEGHAGKAASMLRYM